MFKNSDEEYTNSGQVDDTVIGRSIKIEGDLLSSGPIIVEGEVVGNVKTEQSLTVGENAKVTADVKAKDAVVSGTVQGNVNVQGKLELASTAEVNGDIEASTLTIAAGAVFNGRCAMTEKVAQPEEESAPIEEEEDFAEDKE